MRDSFSLNDIAEEFITFVDDFGRVLEKGIVSARAENEHARVGLVRV